MLLRLCKDSHCRHMFCIYVCCLCLKEKIRATLNSYREELSPKKFNEWYYGVNYG